jgi:hypothetical protein
MASLQDRLIEFFALGNIAQGTKEALWTYIQQQAPLVADQQGNLSLTLGHLDQVREGFQITLRTSHVTSLDELRYLVSRVWFDWDWLAEQGLMLLPDDQVYQVHQQAFAFAHTITALALLPQLPVDQITFPGRPSYADIPVPRSPAEILNRIDELESVLFTSTVKPVEAVEPEPLRRTYGFFETSAWLVFDHLRIFLKGASSE